MAVKIVKGEDITLKVQLKTSDSECYDLTGITAAEAVFKDTTDMDISVTLAGGAIALDGAAGGGKLNITLSDTFTATLKANKVANFEVVVDIGTDKRIIQFFKALNIVDRY